MVDSVDMADRFQAARRRGTTTRLDMRSCPAAVLPGSKFGLELVFTQGKMCEGKMGRLQLLAQTARKFLQIFKSFYKIQTYLNSKLNLNSERFLYAK
jgi:hypothetical protein